MPGDREWAAKMHDDLIDGKKWAVEQGIADPKRFAIMGGSYGGYATLVGLTSRRMSSHAASTSSVPSNLLTLLGRSRLTGKRHHAMFDETSGATSRRKRSF